MKGPHLYLPAYICEARDAYDYAVKSKHSEMTGMTGSRALTHQFT